MKAIALAAANPGLPGAFVGVDYARIKRDVLETFFSILDKNSIKFDYHKTEGHVTIEPSWWGSRLYLLSAEVASRIKGINLAFAIVDEPASFSERMPDVPGTFWEILVSRIRDQRASLPQIALAGTPEWSDSWFTRVFESGPDDPSKRAEWANLYRVIRTSTFDNACHLGSGYIETMVNNFDQVQLRQKLFGIPTVSGEGRAYYEYDRSKHCRPTGYRSEYGPIRVGLDYNVSPMCAVLCQKDGDSLRVFDEIVLQTGDTWRMSDALRVYAERIGTSHRDMLVYPDASGSARSTKGASDTDILKSKGFRVRVRKANPRQRDRLNVVNGMLHHGRLHIDPKCVALDKDLSKVQIDPVTGEIEKKFKGLTHVSDGMGYAAYTLFPIRRGGAEWSGSKPPGITLG